MGRSSIPKEELDLESVFTEYYKWKPDDDWKIKFLNCKVHLQILMTSLGAGKCCAGNTLILTPKGLIKIEDIVKNKSDSTNEYVDSAQTSFEDILATQDENYIYDDNIKNINQITSISNKLRYSNYDIEDKFDMGINDVYTITTQLGFSITGTPEHKIVIIDKDAKLKFKKLQDISMDDNIAITYNTNIFNDNLKLNFAYRGSGIKLQNIGNMNPDIARLLGYSVAEANDSMDNDGEVVITNYDQEIIDDIMNVCAKLGLEGHYKKDKRKPGIIIGVAITSTAFTNFAYYLGYRHGAKNKQVPWSILQADKESQIHFLRSMFDSDGTVYLGISGQTKDGKDKLREVVEYYSSSHELIRQMQIMLLNFGIVARLGTKKGATNKYKGEYRTYEKSYRLAMRGDELLKYARIIGFGLSRKQKILNECVKSINNKDRYTDLTYPFLSPYINMLFERLKNADKKGLIVKTWIEEYILNGKTTILQRKKQMGHYTYLEDAGYPMKTISNYAKGANPNISKTTLDKMLSLLDYDGSLKRCEHKDKYQYTYSYMKDMSDRFVIDQIKEINKGKERVYDVTINDVHSYIGNGVVNHNTTVGCRKTLDYALSNPGAKVVLLEPINWQVSTVLVETFKTVCPTALWNFCESNNMYNKATQTLKLPPPFNSTIYFVSAQNFNRVRGIEVSFIFIDEARELPSPDAFKVLRARLRQRHPDGTPYPNRQIVVGSTPAFSLKWFIDKYLMTDEKINGILTGRKVPIDAQKIIKNIQSIKDEYGNDVFADLSWVYFWGESKDPLYLAQLEDTYSGVALQMERHGRFDVLQMEGMCYNWMTDKNLIDMFDYEAYGENFETLASKGIDIDKYGINDIKPGILDVGKGIEVYYMHDWGINNPILCMIKNGDKKYIVEEKYLKRKILPDGKVIDISTDDIINATRELEHKYGYGPHIPDPSNPTGIADLERNGFKVIRGDRTDVLSRINDVNEEFRQGRLFIEKNKCPETIRELQNLAWDDDATRMKTVGHDHASDAIGYGLRYLKSGNDNSVIISYGLVY